VPVFLLFAKGRCQHEYSPMQGITMLEDMLGVAAWQTSRVTIVAIAPLLDRYGKEGGTTILSAIARRTINAFHFMII
jgi:hypothetical protein